MERIDLVSLLPKGAVGVELGVARGVFSHALLSTGRFRLLFSIDKWAGDRGHNDEEYQDAYALLSQFKESIVLRYTFESVVGCFRDRSLDFVYVDGYAHTGQDQGKTLTQWLPKLKSGGLLAGHDYSERWPLTVKAVDAFVQRNGFTLHVTDETEEGNVYRSWYVKID